MICGAGAGKNVRIGDVIERARKNTKKSIKIEIEIENLHDFKSALDAKPDIIMLDNMPLSDMIKAVSIRNRLSSRNSRVSTRLEASGGVSLSNVRKIASSGVDMISIGALTHSARSLDFSLDVFI